MATGADRVLLLERLLLASASIASVQTQMLVKDRGVSGDEIQRQHGSTFLSAVRREVDLRCTPGLEC
jgi:hypothetical protein